MIYHNMITARHDGLMAIDRKLGTYDNISNRRVLPPVEWKQIAIVNCIADCTFCRPTDISHITLTQLRTPVCSFVRDREKAHIW